MKRIGILSDTHGTWDARFAEHFEECDEVWHAGDIGDLSVLRQLQEVVPTVRAVAGNIDGTSIRQECPTELFFELEGCRILIRHIVGRPGRYQAGITTRLRALRPTITVCGHSHILLVGFDPIYDTLLINPGAAGTYGQQTVRTLLRLNLHDAKPSDLEVIELARH